MTADQLTLLPAPLKISERQQAVLDAIARAGPDGIDADAAGAILHARNGRHSADDRCRWCGRDGKSILAGELRPKGLVRYRRAKGQTPGAWLAVGNPDAPGTTRSDPEPPAWDGSGPVPFGVIPF